MATHETNSQRDSQAALSLHHFAKRAEESIPLLHSETILPQSIIRFHDDSTVWFQHRAEVLGPATGLSKRRWSKDDEFVLDFGGHRVGYLSFRLLAHGLNIDSPTRLHLTFGEVPTDVAEELHPCETWISTAWLPEEILNVDDLPATVKVPRRHAFRYLRVRVIDTSPKYTCSFEDVELQAVSSISPDVYSAVPSLAHSPSDLASEIDRVSRATLRDCMQTVFEDGPRRDRRLWLGDLRLQALTNYATFKDYQLVKRCLYAFASFPRPDGGLPACVFERPELRPASDYIVDYSALFSDCLLRYAQESNDLATAKELYSTAVESLKPPLTHVKDGLFDPKSSSDWKFLDWAEGLDVTAGMHGLVLYAIKACNALAKLVGQPEPYVQEVEEMTRGAQTFLREDGVFVSGPHDQVSHASTAWLALCGAFDKPTAKAAILNALNHPDVVKFVCPYGWHHLAEALALNHAEEEALRLIESYWGGMVQRGADTFWECFDESNMRASPYGPTIANNSFCHAWSCTPSYLLRTLLGGWLGWRAIKIHN